MIIHQKWDAEDDIDSKPSKVKGLNAKNNFNPATELFIVRINGMIFPEEVKTLSRAWMMVGPHSIRFSKEIVINFKHSL